MRGLEAICAGKESNLMRNLQKGKKGRQLAGIWSKKSNVNSDFEKKRSIIFANE